MELNEEYKELLCTLCSAKAATVSAMYQHLHGERHRKKALTQKVEDVIWIKERNQLESLGLFFNHVLPSWWKKSHPLFYLGSVGGVASCFNLTEFNGIWACLVDGQPQMLVIFYITHLSGAWGRLQRLTEAGQLVSASLFVVGEFPTAVAGQSIILCSFSDLTPTSP